MFVVYFISGVAETNRAPFDVAEGESEIVAGFHVEYSGMAFAIFFLAEYANMILIAALTTVMFLGGWLPPFDLRLLLGCRLCLVLWQNRLFTVLFFVVPRHFPRAIAMTKLCAWAGKVFIPLTIVWLVVVGLWMQTPLWFWG